MQTQILTVKQLNIDNFGFKLKLVDGKWQLRLVNKITGFAPIVKTPILIIPFGLSSYAKSKGATENINDWTIEVKAACYESLDLKNIQFDYEDNKLDINKFFEFLEQLFKKAVDFAQENSQKIFKKEIKREIIEEAYVSRNIKKSDKKDGDGNFYPDRATFKLKKNIKNNLFDVIIEDLDGNNIILGETIEENETKVSSLLCKGTPGRFMVQFGSYLVNNKIGITIKLCAAQIDDKKKTGMSPIFSFKQTPLLNKSIDVINNEIVNSVKNTDTDNKIEDSEDDSDESDAEDSEVEVEQN